MYPSHYGQGPSRDPRDRPPPPHRPSYDYDRDRDFARGRDRDWDRDRDRERDGYRDGQRDRGADSYSSRSRDWDAPGSRYQDLDRPPTDGASSSTAPAGKPRDGSGTSTAGVSGGPLPSGPRVLRDSPPPIPPATPTTTSRPALVANPFRDGAGPSGPKITDSPGRILARRKDSLGRDAGKDAGSTSRPSGGSVAGSNASSRDKGPGPAGVSPEGSRRAPARDRADEPSQSLEPGEVLDLEGMAKRCVGLVGEYAEARAEANTANVAHKRLLKITPQTDAMKAKVKTADEERKAAEAKRDALEARCASLLHRIVDAAASEKLRGFANEQSEAVSRLTQQVKEQVEQSLARVELGKAKESAAGPVAATTPSIAAASRAGDTGGHETAAPDARDAEPAQLPPGVGRAGEAPISASASRKRKAEALERLENVEMEQDDLRQFVNEQIDDLHEWVMFRLRSARAEIRRESSRIAEKEAEFEARRRRGEAGVETAPPRPDAQVGTETILAAPAMASAQTSTETQAAGPDDDDVVFTGTNPAPTPAQRQSVAISAPAMALAGTQTIPLAAPTIVEPATPAPPSGPQLEVVALRREVEELRSALAAQGHQLQAILSGLTSRDANLAQKTAEMDRQINALAQHAKVDRNFINGLVTLLSNVPEPPVVGPNKTLVAAGSITPSQAVAQLALAQAQAQQSAGPSNSVQAASASSSANHHQQAASAAAPMQALLNGQPAITPNGFGALPNGTRAPQPSTSAAPGNNLNGPPRSG